MDGTHIMYPDPSLVDTIVGELKSQGTFDQFRKECIADVDTKPAYQNLHQRVESTVANFLEGKIWRPDLNKNQLRDSLRKHIHEMGFLETGVERIVDQVVNPKVNSVFMPQVEDVVYRVQGIPKPEKKPSITSAPVVGPTSKSGGVFNSGLLNQPPPFLPGLSFLPAALQNHMQKAPTLADLLPTDLDPVSPESSKDSEDETEIKDETENLSIVEESGIIQHHEDSMESQLSGISDLTSHGSEHGQSIKSERRTSGVYVEVNDDDSQLSKVSSNSRLSCDSENKDHKEEKPEISSALEVEDPKTNGTSYENDNEKSDFPGGSVVEYGEQFTVEEEVATTIHNEEFDHGNIDKERIHSDDAITEKVVSEKSRNIVDNIRQDNCSNAEKNLSASNTRIENSHNISFKFQDDNSIPQSEDSQFSGSSDNKLHIDEMKEFNSQSENSHQNEDEQSCMKTSSEGFLSEESNKGKSSVENVVEASEEARHGFDDSQDALERPPLPLPPPVSSFENQPPLPPIPPMDSTSEERPPPPPSPPPSRTGASDRSNSPLSEGDDGRLVHTSPSAPENVNERSLLSLTPPLVCESSSERRISSSESQIEKKETSNCAVSSVSSLIGEKLRFQENSKETNECPSLLLSPSGRQTEVLPLPSSTPPLPPSTPPLPPRTPPLPPSKPPVPPRDPPSPPRTPPLPPATPPLPPATAPLPPRTPPLPPRTPPLPPRTPPSPPRTLPVPPATPPLPPATPPLPPATLPLRSETPPLPSATTPVPSATPLPPSATPPLPTATPPLPSSTPPLPSTNPPLPVKPETSQLQDSADGNQKKSPEEDVSRDSNTSYDDGAIPKTPRWEPRSPKEDEKHKFSSFEFLGNKNKIPQSFIPVAKRNDQDDESHSGSEEMQLAWSPLSAHGEDGSEDNSGRRSREVADQHAANSSSKMSSSQATVPEVPVAEKSDLIEEQTIDKEKGVRCNPVDREKSKDRDRAKDGKSKEKHKDDDRAHKESSGSSRKYDEKSKHSRDRKDSHSRSRHDDRNRSDRERDRHSSSSHHRSDDKKRDEKERSSSSRHKSSRSDDRHRHRDKERKSSSSGCSNVRHEDKSRDKTSKSEDKMKSSSRGHSNDRDKRERDRDHRDKDRKSEKDKERSRKDSTRQDEKKRDKERENVKKERNSTICRPNNERRTPDPDSNNGSMFGGNNQTSFSSASKSNQESNNQESGKGTGTSDSNSKSSESSQQNGSSSESSLLLSPNALGSSSSLPFKKRPLLQDNEAKKEYSGKLILTIRKLNRSSKKIINANAKRMRALRKLEKRAVRNLTYLPKSCLKVDNQSEMPPLNSESPTRYFESDWLSKSDDNAFLAYVQDLEQSKTLSGLSDYSGSDSEEEEILPLDDTNTNSEFKSNIVFSLAIVPEDQAIQSASKSLTDSKSKVKKDLPVSKITSNSVKIKNRTRRKKSEDEFEGKRRKFSAKEVVEPAPVEQKSRRARKPNKRYSNDEFTSTFDNEDLEELESIAEDENLETVDSQDVIKNEQSRLERQVLSTSSSESKELVASASMDQQEKENKINIPAESQSSTVCHPPKSIHSQSRETSYSWNRDSYNSNSEDELENTNNENDLIGTALKNLMMESGLGGPDEAAAVSEKPSSCTHAKSGTWSGMQQKSIPLSGVKRVGLSKNYKGSKRLSVKPAVASLSEFSLPLSPDSDVSASNEKVTIKKLKAACSSETLVKDVNTDMNKIDHSRVKQHYNSDDLYKPRPPIRLTSKRQQVVTDHNEIF